VRLLQGVKGEKYTHISLGKPRGNPYTEKGIINYGGCFVVVMRMEGE
jgi:hypothetical protein